MCAPAARYGRFLDHEDGCPAPAVCSGLAAAVESATFASAVCSGLAAAVESATFTSAEAVSFLGLGVSLGAGFSELEGGVALDASSPGSPSAGPGVSDLTFVVGETWPADWQDTTVKRLSRDKIKSFKASVRAKGQRKTLFLYRR